MDSFRWILGLSVCMSAWSADIAKNATTPPTLRYMFPLGTTKGATLRAEMLGDALKGAYAVWCETEGVHGRVEKVEANSDTALGPLKGPGDAGEKPPAERVSIVLEIGRSASPGLHDLRLVTPRGLSTPLQFRVDADPALLETEKPHADPADAQRITLPAILNGHIGKPGEVDYYVLQATRGQKLVFESLSAEGIRPELKLYRPGGSWLNPDRPIPLLFSEQRASILIPNIVRYTYTADAADSYLLGIGSLYGIGGPYFAYEVRVAPASDPEPPLKPAPAQNWQERSFERPLSSAWLEEIRSRTVMVAKPKEEKKASDGGQPGATHATDDKEPHNTPQQATAIDMPALLEGSIQKPGTIDFYRLKIKSGEKLAFEIETPGAKPPYFAPEITLTDSAGHEVLSNVEEHSSPIATDGHPISYLKRVVPKLAYAPQGDGEYVLKVRDITSRYGDESYRYRLLIRPQIPHVGAIAVKDADQVNLIRGEARKISIEADAEEGFEGEVVYDVIGLPPGVEAFPGAAEPPGNSPDVVEHDENLSPRLRQAVIVLMAKPEAQVTRIPVLARLEFRPVVDGHVGDSHLVREIPLMVIAKEKEEKVSP